MAKNSVTGTNIPPPCAIDAWEDFYYFFWDVVRGWAEAYGCPDTLSKIIFQETMIEIIRRTPPPPTDSNAKKARIRSVLKDTITSVIKKFPQNASADANGFIRPLLQEIVCRKVGDAFRRGVGLSSAEPQGINIRQETIASPFRDFHHLSDPEEALLDSIWFQGLIAHATRRACAKADYIASKLFFMHVIEGVDESEIMRRLCIVKLGDIHDFIIRFADKVQEEFFLALESVDGPEMVPQESQRKSAMCESVFEEFLKRKANMGEAAIFSSPPTGLLERLEFVSQILRRTPPPSAEPCLCHVILGESADVSVMLDTQTEAINKSEISRSGTAPSEAEKESASYEWIPLPAEFKIGRKAGNDLVLPSPHISGSHAVVRNTAYGWLLRDENSFNGTFLNGAPAHAEVLAAGDFIQIDSCHQLIFFDKL